MDISDTRKLPVVSEINKAATAGIGVAFDGAERFERSIASWNPQSYSADLDILPDKEILDARSKDAIKNDGYMAGALQSQKNGIVGNHFKIRVSPKYKMLGKTEEWAKEFKEEMEQAFTAFAESKDNWVDASRVNNFTSLIRLGVSIHCQTGELLATSEWIRQKNRPFKTAIQMIDPDRLQNPYAAPPTERLRGGVEKDRYGAPIAYHILNSHPIDYAYNTRFLFKKVQAYKPWGRKQVIHIYEQERADQTRGVSDLIAVLEDLHMCKKFRKIVLQNAVVQATYAAVIESDMPPEAAYAALGAGNLGESSLGKMNQEHLTNIAKYVSNSKNMHIDGTKLVHLYPGSKLKMVSPGQGGPLGTDFEASLLRHIASSLGVSYEELSKNFSDTNYSSARAALNETYKNMQAKKTSIADRFATEIYLLWLEEAMMSGMFRTIGPQDAELFYSPLGKEAFGNCSWIGAGRGQIDELKETQAAFLRVNAKLSTREQEAAKLGVDWDEVVEGLSIEKQKLEERGLSLDEESNMMNSVEGKAGQAEPEEVN